MNTWTWMTRLAKASLLGLPLILTACPADIATPISAERDMSQSSLVEDDELEYGELDERGVRQVSDTERVEFKLPAPEGGGSNKGAHLQLSADGKSLRVERAGKAETIELSTGNKLSEEIVAPKADGAPEARSEDGKVEVRGNANKVIVESPDLNKGRPLEVKMHKNAVTQVAIAPDASVVVSGSSDGSICVWKVDAKSKASCALLPGAKSVSALSVSDKAGHAFAGFQGGSVGRVSIRNTPNEALRAELNSEREVLSVASDAEGTMLFVLDDELEVSGFRVLSQQNEKGAWLEPLMIEREVIREVEVAAPTSGPKRPKETDYCRCASRGPDGSCIGPTQELTFRDTGGAKGVNWFGGACINRPIQEVWALTRELDKVKSSDVNNPVIVNANMDGIDPKFSHRFIADYKVNDFITVDWRMEWFHSPKPLGEQKNPMVVVINYQKTAGSGWISKIEGSWALKAIAPNVTAFAVQETVDATRTGIDKVRGEFERLIGILRGK